MVSIRSIKYLRMQDKINNIKKSFLLSQENFVKYDPL